MLLPRTSLVVMVVPIWVLPRGDVITGLECCAGGGGAEERELSDSLLLLRLLLCSVNNIT